MRPNCSLAVPEPRVGGASEWRGADHPFAAAHATLDRRKKGGTGAVGQTCTILGKPSGPDGDSWLSVRSSPPLSTIQIGGIRNHEQSTAEAGIPVRATPPKVSPIAVIFAVGVHVAYLAVTATWINRIPPPQSPSSVELLVRFEPEPEVAKPQLDFSVTATPTPGTAPSPSSEATDAPVLAKAGQAEPSEPAPAQPLEPAHARPVAPPEPGVAFADQPDETPAPSTALAMPSPPHRHPPLILTHHATTATQVAVARNHPPTATAGDTKPDHLAGPQIASPLSKTAGRSQTSGGIADPEASLEGEIRDAVQAAVHYPAAARMMGLTGRVRVQLNYRNGSVDAPLLAQSSGMNMLDQAALSAAQGAHYPATPPDLAGRLMRFLIWVEFRSV